MMRPTLRSWGFWTRASLIVLGMFLLIGVIVLRGDQRDVVPVGLSPSDRATSVSTRPIIRAIYASPMDAASLRASFQINPLTPGNLEVSGSELTFVPARPLHPDATYTIDLRAGVRKANGKASRQDVQVSFHTRPSRLIVLRQTGTMRNAWGVDPTSGKTWQITNEPQGVASVAPSPDGDELAFITREGTDHWSLWASKVDGSGRRSILQHQPGVVVNLAWSPRGDLLAYDQADVFGSHVSNTHVWVVRADGTQTSLLYGRGEETGSAPVWSPDGRRLAFYENHFTILAVFNFTKTLVTIPTDGQFSGHWSPDGSALVFFNRTGVARGHTALEVARLNGGTPVVQQITDGMGNDSSPTWSPADDWIAFDSVAPTGESGIWLTQSDGSRLHPLQQDRGWVYLAPIWSPDGSEVAFSRRPTQGAPEFEIWVGGVNGQPHRLDGRGQIAAWIP